MGRLAKWLSTIVVAILIAGSGGVVGVAPTSAAVRYTPSSKECQFLTIINRYRVGRNLPRLVLSRPLGAAAEDHTADMVRRRSLYHTPNLLPTLKRYGFKGRAAGENVAMGYASATSVFSGWRRSSGHRQNMLNRRFRAIGIAEQNGYWTTIFGDRADGVVRC